MKLTYYTIICIAFFTNAFGQSISLQPNSLQLPRVASNPACTVTDKGKVVFNTNQNKILYCNGSAWIDPESGEGVRITPAFSAQNTSGMTLTETEEVIRFTSESFDLNNNFNLNNATTDENTFIVPDNGVYELKLNFKINFTDFVPASNTRVTIKLTRYSPGSTSTNYYFFRVKSGDDNEYFDLTKIYRCPGGTKVNFSAEIDFPPNSGSLKIDDISLNGHLISWY